MQGKKNPKLQEAYNGRASNQGKVSRKEARMCMLAWMKQGEDINATVKNLTTIDGNEGTQLEKPWLSKKELYDKFGEEEAEEMIAEGCITIRPNPANKRRFQYQVCNEKSYAIVEKKKTLQVGQDSKVEGKVASHLAKSIEQCPLTVDMLAGVALDMGLDMQDAMKDPDFQALLEETQEFKKGGQKMLALCDGTSEVASTLGCKDGLTAELLKEQLAEKEAKKEERDAKREQAKQQKEAKEAKLGLHALAKIDSKNVEVSSEDVLAMLKEMLAQGQKIVADATVTKAKITKDRFSKQVIHKYATAHLALRASYDALLTTQGLYQQKKCRDSFALKSIAQLARSVLKMKEVFEETSLKH